MESELNKNPFENARVKVFSGETGLTNGVITDYVSRGESDPWIQIVVEDGTVLNSDYHNFSFSFVDPIDTHNG